MWRCDPAARFVLAALAWLTSAAFGRPLLGLPGRVAHRSLDRVSDPVQLRDQLALLERVAVIIASDDPHVRSLS